MKAKPSELAAAIKVANDAAEPIRAQLAPYQEQLESLKLQKAAIVNEYGEKIRQVRNSNKVAMSEFVKWRNEILTIPSEDDRCVAIDTKLAELGIS